MPEYNKEEVDRAIRKDPRIKPREAKLIHALLKGRARKKTRSFKARG